MIKVKDLLLVSDLEEEGSTDEARRTSRPLKMGIGIGTRPARARG